MKTKLLFIMESLCIGGAEKSLLSLLSKLDYERFEVELFLFRHNGELMERLPPSVRLVPQDQTFAIFARSRKLAPLRYLIRGDAVRAWHSLCYLVGCVFQRLSGRQLYIGWNHVRHLFSTRGLSADIAVAYLERKSTYFTADYVKADRKVSFVHNDYRSYPYDRALDTYYFAAFERIATVSEHSKQVLQELFPDYADRFVLVPNIVSAQAIRVMADEPLPQPSECVECDERILRVVTVGRLVRQKGYDRALRICRLLLDRGFDVQWVAVGEGEQRAELERQIQILGLHGRFVLVGASDNPYPWMKAADVYVQPSRFEGFGITVAEAMCLGKRIVCSDIPEFRDQLASYPNARWVDTDEGFANAICELREQPEIPYVVHEEQPTEFYRCIGIEDAASDEVY